MLEIVQGEGGLNLLNADYLYAIQKYCQAEDVLLIIDEVQTGIGCTGKMFAYQHFDLQPDIVTLAKRLGGGLPIGAVLFGEKCENTLGRGDHGSTFGANPISCAAANTVIDKLTPHFLNAVLSKGEQLKATLSKLPKVRAVSGLGLMIGVEFEQGIEARDVVARAMQKGVLFLTAKHKLRLLPPLIISEQQLEEALRYCGQFFHHFNQDK